jgi:hypothetical protein
MSPVTIEREGTWAVMAVDPGGTTGVCAGWVELKPTLKATLLEGIERLKTTTVTGDYIEQGRELLDIWIRFCFGSNERNIPIQKRTLAVENFVLRRREGGGATGNLTSCWVGGAFGMALDMSQLGVDIRWQTASDGKRKATNDRLKMWNLYEPGETEHERDAKRHFALCVDRIIG